MWTRPEVSIAVLTTPSKSDPSPTWLMPTSSTTCLMDAAIDPMSSSGSEGVPQMAGRKYAVKVVGEVDQPAAGMEREKFRCSVRWGGGNSAPD